MSGHDHAEIDARLNETFRHLPDTDELRDLRDEVRAGLVARAEELESGGTGPSTAIAAAFAEFGDIQVLAAEIVGQDALDGGAENPAAAATGARAFDLAQRHRVRPKPVYVVRTVALSAITALGLALTLLGILYWPLAATAAVALVLLAVPIGALVADGTHQETTAHFPMPAARSAGYGGAAFLAVAGLALCGLFLTDTAQIWLIAVGAPALVLAIVWFSYLGATQTNRTKPWMREVQAQYRGTDRFSQDEAAAARFGIYTVVVWVVAIAAFVVLSFTVGFAWSWLALVAGFVVFFLVLARMLFPSGTAGAGASDRTDGAHRD